MGEGVNNGGGGSGEFRWEDMIFGIKVASEAVQQHTVIYSTR